MTPVNRHEGNSDDAYVHNEAFWDEVTPVHAGSDFYRVDEFRRGADVLHDFIVEEVGDVSGLSMLHLQCHFGLDTLNWARLGAVVTGVDISGASIERARELASELGIPATFVRANVLEMGDRFDGRFDRVFTSIGALCWIGDLDSWGRVIARALKPGGVFYIAEFHPVMDTLQQSRPITESSAAYPGYPYFGDGVPLRFDPEGDDSDYAEASFTSAKSTFEWFHPVSEVIEVLINAGLTIKRFREFPFVTYKARQGMIQGDDGLWRLPPEVVPLPLMFSVAAVKAIA
ncbi:MAG: class I SAM-dependent methyltransferase [Dehalococcoidia bacterium]|nr:class I SAM-dependent methyltransferase [Dehalococcoidia bacterium]